MSETKSARRNARLSRARTAQRNADARAAAVLAAAYTPREEPTKVGAGYLATMAWAAEREVWASRVVRATPQGTLTGSRYSGGASVRPRCN